MLKKLVCSTLVAGGLVIGGCSSSDDDDDFVNDGPNPPLGEVDVDPVATPGVGNSVYDNIVNNSDLSTLRIAIDTAGLADALDNEENEFTVFAPNNAAFLQLDAIFWVHCWQTLRNLYQPLHFMFLKERLAVPQLVLQLQPVRQSLRH